MKYLEINGAATLFLKYASLEAGLDQHVLDSTNTKVGGRGPTFITYPLITGYANAELKVYTPEREAGGVSSSSRWYDAGSAPWRDPWRVYGLPHCHCLYVMVV